MGRSPAARRAARAEWRGAGAGFTSARRYIEITGSPRGPVRAGRKAHIGEVQASVWDDETLNACKEAGVILL